MSVAVLFLCCCFGILAGGVISWLVPKLIQQVAVLVNNVPHIVQLIQDMLNGLNRRLSQYDWLKNVDFKSYAVYWNTVCPITRKPFATGLTNSVGTVIGMATSVTILAVTVPVMLLYMLKDGQKLMPALRRMLPT